MKKRLVIVGIMAALTLSVTACGGKDTKTADNKESIQTEIPDTEEPEELVSSTEKETEVPVTGKLEEHPAEPETADIAADKKPESATSDKKTAASGNQSSASGSSTKADTAGSGNAQVSGSGTTAAPAHVHTWVVNQGSYHMETQVMKEAWDEPVYEMKELSVCNICSADITGNTGNHIEAHMLAGDSGVYGYHSEWVQVQTGTTHHDAETTGVMVWDVKPYSQCSGCGEISVVGAGITVN